MSLSEHIQPEKNANIVYLSPRNWQTWRRIIFFFFISSRRPEHATVITVFLVIGRARVWWARGGTTSSGEHALADSVMKINIVKALGAFETFNHKNIKTPTMTNRPIFGDQKVRHLAPTRGTAHVEYRWLVIIKL